MNAPLAAEVCPTCRGEHRRTADEVEYGEGSFCVCDECCAPAFVEYIARGRPDLPPARVALLVRQMCARELENRLLLFAGGVSQ